MELFNQKGVSSPRAIAFDDLFLTTDMPTTGGSAMLDGYMSLFEAEVITRLRAAGFENAGKCSVGEFGIDLLGETSYRGATEKNGVLVYAPCEAVKSGEAFAALTVDINGAPRRGAAQSKTLSLKPTYGTVSRYGIIGVASSGETVSVVTRNAADCKEVLKAIAGHDDKDGTSLAQAQCESILADGKAKKVALFSDLLEEVSDEVKDEILARVQALKKEGVEVVEVESDVIRLAGAAWNILMSAEACNNVSRFDGVKYGHRSTSFTNLDELYTFSRTEAFGDLIKKCILFGSECLSTENYMPVYDKALRTRRIIKEAFDRLFETFDAVLLPASSKKEYSTKEVQSANGLSYEENLFTAPASITGLPAVVASGVQMIGKAFSEGKLLYLAEILEKEEKK